MCSIPEMLISQQWIFVQLHLVYRDDTEDVNSSFIYDLKILSKVTCDLNSIDGGGKMLSCGQLPVLGK